MSNVIQLGINNDAIAELTRPPLDKGRYLAAVLKVEPKINEETGSFGLNWTLLVNKDPNSVNEGWNPEAYTIEQRNYTYIGKLEDGKVRDTSKAFSTIHMLKALGVKNMSVLNPDEVKFRQLIIEVDHKPHYLDVQNGVDDPRMVPEIVKTLSYSVGEEIAPKLENLADLDEPVEDGAAADEF